MKIGRIRVTFSRQEDGGWQWAFRWVGKLTVVASKRDWERMKDKPDLRKPAAPATTDSIA